MESRGKDLERQGLLQEHQGLGSERDPKPIEPVHLVPKASPGARLVDAQEGWTESNSA